MSYVHMYDMCVYMTLQSPMFMQICKLVLCPLDLHLPLPVDMHSVL